MVGHCLTMHPQSNCVTDAKTYVFWLSVLLIQPLFESQQFVVHIYLLICWVFLHFRRIVRLGVSHWKVLWRFPIFLEPLQLRDQSLRTPDAIFSLYRVLRLYRLKLIFLELIFLFFFVLMRILLILLWFWGDLNQAKLLFEVLFNIRRGLFYWLMSSYLFHFYKIFSEVIFGLILVESEVLEALMTSFPDKF